MAVTNNANSTIIFTAGSDAVTGSKFVRYLRWEGMTAAGDDLVVNEASGKNIVTVKAETEHLPVEIPLDRMVDGLTVATMDAGLLIAFLG
jgi:hypothetical protein